MTDTFATSDPFAMEDRDLASFMQGGSSATGMIFPTVGHRWTGTVTARELRQRTAAKGQEHAGQLQFWYQGKATAESLVPEWVKGDPKNRCMQLVLSLQCEPTGQTWETRNYIPKPLPDDDGMRALYVKGGMVKALADAVKEKLGHGIPEIGGLVEVVRTQDVRAQGSGNPMHTHAFRYTPAAQNTHPTSRMGGGVVAQGASPFAQPAAAPADPWGQPQAAPVAQQPDPWAGAAAAQGSAAADPWGQPQAAAPAQQPQAADPWA